MNERIEELYEEASYSSYVRTDGNGNDHYRKNTDYEKFAELIIRECINIVNSSDGDLDFAVFQLEKLNGRKD